MSQLQEPEPVKLIFAVFSSLKERIKLAAAQLEEDLGPFDYISGLTIFDQTEYYTPEMGSPLYKRYFSLEEPVSPVRLIEAKLKAIDVEKDYLADGRRTVNIDPGYLAINRLVLSSGKNAAHRIYLDRGIWAELTLVYQSGGFKTLPWTYPDFATQEVQAAMTDIRRKYLEQRRK